MEALGKAQMLAKVGMEVFVHAMQAREPSARRTVVPYHPARWTAIARQG
jgi:hypothetical protein